MGLVQGQCVTKVACVDGQLSADFASCNCPAGKTLYQGSCVRMRVAGLVAHWPQTRANAVSAGKVCISIMGFVSKENRALIVFGKRL